MLEFHPITLEDRKIIHKHLYAAQGKGSEYSFANLYFWSNSLISVFEKQPLYLCRYGKWNTFLLPNSRAAVQALRDYAEAKKLPCRFFGLSAIDKAWLEQAFPGVFRFRLLRDSFDYVYDIKRLCSLSGKKLQAKRNHCNHFEKTYPDYRVVPLTEELLPRVRAFTERWYQEHLASHPYADTENEQKAITGAFDHMEALQMEGLVLTAEEKIVAFSMGNRIREDTFDVNFEKALAELNGAYPMVNREFARKIHEKYPEIRYLNREDDMGIEGLRKAKESYFPDILLEKYVAEEV